MTVQSCSIDVPGRCPNKCKCCVSELSKTKKFLQNKLSCLKDISHNNDTDTEEQYQNIFNAYRDRLAYVREKTDTAVLTGTASEPVFNIEFLVFFNNVNRSLSNPFYNIELQTAGIGLDVKRLKLLKKIGVKTLALSLFSIDSETNNQIQQSPKGLYYNIKEICDRIKEMDFNLRVCFNINREGFGDNPDPRALLEAAKLFGADQITFRKLYHNGDTSAPETQWVLANQLENFFPALSYYIISVGNYKRTLDYGAKLYTVDGMSIVVDDDCMAKSNDKALKYLIVRRNIKIYSDWDDEGSLIF